MMSMLRLPWRLVVSLVLGGITWGVFVLVATKLPPTRVTGEIADVVGLPALLIAGIFFPEGGHTGGGVPYFGYVLLGCGIFFYAVMWFVILSWLSSRGPRSATTR